MAEATVEGVYSLTAPTVMAFPSLLEAKKFKRNGKETGEAKFGGTFVFEPDAQDLKDMKALCARLAKGKWPGQELAKIKFPFKSGDKEIERRIAKLKKEGKEYKGENDFMKGKVVLKASSKYPPRLSVILNGKPVDLDGDALKANAGKFYFGVQTLAQFNFVPYDAIEEGDSDGVTAYLNLVLSLNKGDKLTTSRQSAAETFSRYIGHSTEEDPTQVGGSDEIPVG